MGVEARQSTPPRAYVVWGVGLLAYLVAIFHRFSLGVAGLEASQRFGISATTLSMFSVLQLGVYAAMQVPVGVLLDRFGSRRLIASGALLMACGQGLFAFADSLPMALVARVLIGAGDATTFISVLRLVALWFPPYRNPVLVQLTGQIGQLGAILSATPLVSALSVLGWTTTYAAAAGVSLVVAVAVAGVVRDAPPGLLSPPAPPPSSAPSPPTGVQPLTAAPDQPGSGVDAGQPGPGVDAGQPGPGVDQVGAAGRADEQPSLAEVRRALGEAWREPGTRLGLATHFVTQFSGVVFAALWGFPFLVAGQGRSPAVAGSLLMLLTVAGMVFGPLLGTVVARHPYQRSSLVLGAVGLTGLAWGLVLAWPGRAPLGVLVFLMLALAANGPASAIGFDYARTFNPPHRLGSATGIVNVGGFFASLLTLALLGLVLDLVGGGARPGPQEFRVAFAVQYPVWALGTMAVLHLRRATRRRHGLSPDHPLPTTLTTR